MSVSRANRAMVHSSLLFVLLAVACLPWADLSISAFDPWFELTRLGGGLLQPSWPPLSILGAALANTLAFALQGVALGAGAGLLLAAGYRRGAIRRLAAGLRAVHELFWALLFIQLLGISPLTGVLAIALPYAGTFAKVFGELFEEADPAPEQALFADSGEKLGWCSRLCFLQLPLCWRQMSSYIGYRLECGIRSSAVLGFIGLPTLGYHLESLLRQGYYAEAASFFYALVLLIATLKWWWRPRLLLAYLAAALWWLPPQAVFNWPLTVRFFTQDIVPAPLRSGEWGEFLPWLHNLWAEQIAPGVLNTLVLALLALVVMAVLALLWFPAISRRFGNRGTRIGSHLGLVLMRALPEYLLAFIGTLLLGPSMLPAIAALGLHNGAIIAHLLGHHLNSLRFREDAPTGVNLYLFEVLPRLYRPFMAYSLYRFENLVRETAILGMLGIPTLGFYIDSAFSEFRLDRAMLLLLVCAALNITIDVLARRLRRYLHLSEAQTATASR